MPADRDWDGFSLPGTWSGPQPITFGYQWLRCTTQLANCRRVDTDRPSFGGFGRVRRSVESRHPSQLWPETAAQTGEPPAAAFLKAFAGEGQWAHLDIAGTAWAEVKQPYQPKGATGVAVRLLIDLALTAGRPLPA